MKTTKLMAMMAVLLTAGCSQNEITEVSPDAHPTIGFGVYTGVQTKGQDVTNTTMQEACDASHNGGFGIMGYFTGSKNWETAKGTVAPSFMYNQLVTYDKAKTSWTYTPVKYWPNNVNDKVSFFAYAPYEPDGNKHGIQVSARTETGIPEIVFTLKDKDNLDKMLDLVVSKALDKTSADGKISFPFSHTLSKISFKVKAGDDYEGLDGDNSFIYVTKMWIVGKTGNLSDSGNPLKNGNSKFYTKAAWKDLHWDYTDAVVSNDDFDIKQLMDVDAGITEVDEDGTNPTTITGVKVINTTAKDLFKSNEFLYLIPIGDNAEIVDSNENSGGCVEGDIKIGFHYDIVTKSTNNDKQYLVSHAETAVSLPAHHMKRNKAYVYTFTINLKKIEVSAAEVADWGKGGDGFTIQ